MLYFDNSGFKQDIIDAVNNCEQKIAIRANPNDWSYIEVQTELLDCFRYHRKDYEIELFGWESDQSEWFVIRVTNKNEGKKNNQLTHLLKKGV